MERDEKEGKDFLGQSSAESLESRDIVRKDSVTQNDQKKLIEEGIQKSEVMLGYINNLLQVIESEEDKNLLSTLLQSMQYSVYRLLSIMREQQHQDKIEQDENPKMSTEVLQSICNSTKKGVLDTDRKRLKRTLQNFDNEAKEETLGTETKRSKESDCATSTQEFAVESIEEVLQNINNIDVCFLEFAR